MAGQLDRSREVQFMLESCSPNPASAGATPRCAMLDWSWIEETAQEHGVTPLVARRLGAIAESVDAADACQRFATLAVANELRNQYLLAQLADLIRGLGSASIGALAFNGPVLAQLAYGNIGLRSFSDLDVLVRCPDVPRAVRLFEGLGFTAEGYDEVAFHADFFHTVEVNLRGPDGVVNLDLHWELSPGYYPYGPRGNELWDRAIIASVGGAQIPTLAPEDHLLHLMVHGSRHGWLALSQICDIAHFVARVNLDWATVLERAARGGCARMLRIGLMLSHDLLAAEIPADILETARADAKASALAIKLRAGLMTEPRRDGSFRGFARSLGGLEHPGEHLRYIAVHALAPTLIDWRWRPLARWLYPAYYLLRPVRIAGVLMRRLGSRVARLFAEYGQLTEKA
jgi:hypothetical protein